MEITPISSNPNPVGKTGTKPNGNDEVSKDAFMRLLVSQIKNQDPLNPTDGVQFLSQLAQFSQLEQMLGIRSDLAAIIQNTTAQNTTAVTEVPTGGTDE